jgi:hypothetical protein
MDILSIEYRQALLAGKAGFAKGRDQRSKLRWSEARFNQNRHATQIQQRVAKPAFAAGVRQRLERLLAGLKIEVRPRVETYELTRPDNLQI